MGWLLYGSTIVMKRTRTTYPKWPTEIVTLETGSIIHWDQGYYSRNRYYRIPVTCGGCLRQRTIEATKTRCNGTRFTGLCYRWNIDYQIANIGSGDSHPAWRGGRVHTGGYRYIQLSILQGHELEIA